MVVEGERFKEDDVMETKRVEMKNGFESYCHDIKSLIEGILKHLVSEDEKKNILRKVGEVEKWLDDNSRAAGAV